MNTTLSWFSIIRLGLVQMALGSIIVLTTSTLNRLMIVEGALPAVIPGLLVSFHYGIQITRPAWGFFSDTGRTRTKWILIGMCTLALGGILATVGVILIKSNFLVGIITSIAAYGLIGLGVGAAGTSLLAYLAIATALVREKREEHRDGRQRDADVGGEERVPPVERHEENDGY